MEITMKLSDNTVFITVEKKWDVGERLTYMFIYVM